MAEGPSGFESPVALSLPAENKPFVEALAEVRLATGENSDPVEEGQEVPEELEDEDGEETDIGKIMRYGQRPGACLPQASKVEHFCRGVPTATLAALGSKTGLSRSAWLHQRSCQGARNDLGPLAANELYKALRKPVSQSRDRRNAADFLSAFGS